jgi:hypothetical protein
MNLEISTLGVILATLSVYVVGGLWYSPSFFLRQWQAMAGADDDHMKKTMPKAMVLFGINGLITAYVLAHLISYAATATGTTGITAGVQGAFWAWLGVSLTTVIANGGFDPRPAKMMVIQAGERLVTLLVMGAVLGYFM